MTVDIDIERAVKYPMESDDWVKTILIGGILLIFSWLIVPIILVYGYVVRVLRAGMNDDPRPPGFDDWGDLLSEGFPAFVIAFVYGLVPLIVFAVTVGGSILAMATGSRAGAGLGIAGLLGGMLLTILLGLVFGYFGLAAIAHYAYEGSLGAGFDFGVVIDVALDRDYAIPWLYGIGVVIAGGVVASVLGAVPILGAIIGVFVSFYAQVAAARLWGMGYADARNVGSVGGTAEVGGVSTDVP